MPRFTLKTECPHCRKRYVPELVLLDPKQFLEAWAKWDARTLMIQDAFPASKTIQREQLQTGICSDECWDDFLKGE